MSSAFYFIVAAIVFVVAAIVLLVLGKVQSKNNHYSEEFVIGVVVAVLLLSLGWIVALPTVIVAFTIYFGSKGISKWLNK